MERARHVLRVGFVLVVLVSVMMIGRTFLVPASYGMAGPYRFDNVAEQQAKPVMHGGQQSCKSCHEKEWTLWSEAEVHLKVACESCHGPLAKHAQGDQKIGDAVVNKSWQQCATCHRKLEGRPSLVPQVDFSKHKDVKLDGDACAECHNPHSTMYEE
jgi:hypothetical protein